MPLDRRHDKQFPSSQAELNTTRLEANPYQRGGLKAYFGDPQILTYLMALRQYGIAATPVRIKPIQIQFRCFSKFHMYGNSPTPANKQRFIPTSGTYPKGFLAGGTSVGIKPASNSRPDLVLVASGRRCCGAAVFTRNEFPAASITVTKGLVRKNKGRGLRGVIVNSGCANTLTGKAGLEDAAAMSKEADKHVSGEPGAERESSVMVMHTGVGGQRLPIKDIIQSIPKLHKNMGSSHSHWLEAAKGICTTDTFPKLASRTFGLPSLPNTTFSLAGITKGAGMIHPNIATTLGIICTDAPITPPALQHLLSTAASTSYNSISIDGDTSTNDMVAMLANGAAAPNETQDIDYCPSSPHQSPDFLAFQHILDDFMATMAKLVVRDGEGASKFITIRVRNSPSSAAGAAKHIASVIARSVLVKTAIYGEEANWGACWLRCGIPSSILNTREGCY